MGQVVFTIGYGGKTVDEFVEALLKAGVDRVVDVRAAALSRKKGFSKNGLSDALGRKGIDYVHLPAAGNPYRDIKEDAGRCLAMYAAHLDANPAVLDAIEAMLNGRDVALLCMEADARHCHRSIIADRLRRRDPMREVRDL